MTPEEAQQVLNLGYSASPDEVAEAYRQRVAELEKKIERAPTPGLKEKYRAQQARFAEAHATLGGGSNSADESLNLPTLAPIEKKAPPESPAATSPARPSSTPVEASPVRKAPPYIAIAAFIVSFLVVGYLINEVAFKKEAVSTPSASPFAQKDDARTAPAFGPDSSLDDLKRGVDAGNAVAAYWLAYHGDPGGEWNVHEDVISLYRRSADQGYAPAEVRLGEIVAHGRGTPKDDTEAAILYRKAADQGDADGEVHLANMDAGGWGTPKNIEEAMMLYQKASDQGDLEGTLDLASMYMADGDAPKDAAKAASLLLKPAQQGSMGAKFALQDEFVSPMSHEDMTTFSQIIMPWLLQAANQGDRSVSYMLGMIYLNGYGVDPNKKQAIDWLKKSEAGDDPHAKDELHHLGIE
jgi:TPR repeat protein